LLRTLLDMAKIPFGEFPYDPSLGDSWNSRERELSRRARDVAGWLRLGRPRREAGRVAFRIALRRRVLEAHGALTALAAALLEKATATSDLVMADHTYLQPAEPTTFGYILLSYSYPVLRYAERLRRSFAAVNLSPAGAGGVGGTILPLERDRLAELLGFDGIIVHARDAMWETDTLIELTATAAGAAVHAGQIASDLEIFASPTFGFMEFPDAFSRASALMPQKKNPYPVAVVRGAGGMLSGCLAGLLSTLRTPTARTDHFLYAYGEVPKALDLLSSSHRLLAGVVRDMAVFPEALAKSAESGFLGAADVATALVLNDAIDYETAHRAVGRAVRAGSDEGAARLDPARVAEEIGKPLTTETEARINADPASVVRARMVKGGTAPTRIEEMLSNCRRWLQEENDWRANRTDQMQVAEARLVELAERMSTLVAPGGTDAGR